MVLQMRKVKPGEPLATVTSKTEVGVTPADTLGCPGASTTQPHSVVRLRVESRTFDLCCALDASGLKS